MAFEVIAKSFRVCVYKTSTAGSEVVWRNQPRAPRKMDTYTLPQIWRSCRRCSRGEIPANPCMYVHVRISCYRALIRLVAVATIRERRLFRSTLAQVRLLFESGVYSREASIRSYTVYVIAWICENRPLKEKHFVQYGPKVLQLKKTRDNVVSMLRCSTISLLALTYESFATLRTVMVLPPSQQTIFHPIHVSNGRKHLPST